VFVFLHLRHVRVNLCVSEIGRYLFSIMCKRSVVYMCKYKDYLRTANNKKLVLSYLLLIMIRL